MSIWDNNATCLLLVILYGFHVRHNFVQGNEGRKLVFDYDDLPEIPPEMSRELAN